jgi:hypothetical protein
MGYILHDRMDSETESATDTVVFKLYRFFKEVGSDQTFGRNLTLTDLPKDSSLYLFLRIS